MTIRTAIVVEGGAMRGVFSAGVLDVLHERGINDFDLAIGTSAGACNLASFLAGQHGRNLRCYTNIMARRELFSLSRMLRGGHYMDLDWLWQRFAHEEPLDQQAIARHRTLLVSVATCATTGGALYLTPRAESILDDLKGGCAVPLMYRGPVSVNGQVVVDGGVTDPIPAAEAYRRGARRLLVIRSRPAHVSKSKSVLDPILGALLRGQPVIAKAARDTPLKYQQAVAFLAKPPEDVQIVQLAPSALLRTGRTTRDRKVLQQDYELGRALAERELPRIRALVSEPERSDAAKAAAQPVAEQA